MAKKEPETGTEKAAQTGPRILKQLVNAWNQWRTDRQRAGEGFAELRQTAIEKHHLHPQALAQALKESKWEGPKLRNFYDALDYYRDEMGLYDRAESSPPLDMTQTEVEEEEEAEEGKSKKTNVKKFPAPNAVAAE